VLKWTSWCFHIQSMRLAASLYILQFLCLARCNIYVQHLWKLWRTSYLIVPQGVIQTHRSSLGEYSRWWGLSCVYFPQKGGWIKLWLPLWNFWFDYVPGRICLLCLRLQIFFLFAIINIIIIIIKLILIYFSQSNYSLNPSYFAEHIILSIAPS